MQKQPKAPKTTSSSASSLSQFISTTREKLGLSQSGLAKKCSLNLVEIENIENGTELFLSSTTRQKLTKGLRVSLDEIKLYEKTEDFDLAPQRIIDEIRDEIIEGRKEIFCPKCSSLLITRIAKLYDLEDNLMLHPKARCSKCVFQIT